MKKRVSINDMTVKAKIITYSVIMFFLMLIISSVGFWSSSSVNKVRSNRYNNYAMGQYYLKSAYSDFADIKVRLRNVLYIYSEDPTGLQEQMNQMQSYEQAVKENLGKFEERLSSLDSSINSKYNNVVKNMNDYIEFANRLAQNAKVGNVEQARMELATNGVTTADNVEKELLQIMNEMEKASAENNETVEFQQKALMAILLVVSLIAEALTIGDGILLVKSITAPIKKLSIAAKKMAVGDIDIDCEKIHNDDIGELMDNFNDMTAAIREQAKLAEVMSKGDYTADVVPRSDKDILGKAIRKMLLDENITLNSIKEAGIQITVGSEQVANASQALAQGSTEQASALEQVTASMDEVTQRTKDNAVKAGEADVLVSNIKEMATSGNEQMKSMIQAMDSINESSETISKIIKTIDDIAFQTNILALNAAVEAARAGVHGKGFAVVAEEVRNLAAKSASAASETAEMIEDSIRKIANGTKLAEATGKSLDEIVASIEEIVGLINNIAVSSNDQSTAISQIDQAISQVSTVVQTNAATSEQCAAASEELSNQAATLRKLIGQYKLVSMGKNNTYNNNSNVSSYDDSEPVISLDGDFGKY